MSSFACGTENWGWRVRGYAYLVRPWRGCLELDLFEGVVDFAWFAWHLFDGDCGWHFGRVGCRNVGEKGGIEVVEATSRVKKSN